MWPRPVVHSNSSCLSLLGGGITVNHVPPFPAIKITVAIMVVIIMQRNAETGCLKKIPLNRSNESELKPQL